MSKLFSAKVSKSMNHVIILAAGQGQRMKDRKDKLLLEAGGKPVIYYSLVAFNDHPETDSITIVANKLNKDKIKQIVELYHFKKVGKIIIGGLTRQKSLEKGLKSFEKSAKKDDVILVHNAANPLPSLDEISACLKRTEEEGACIVGHYITSTVKEISGKHIIKTHDRDNLFAAETPQCVQFGILKKALKHAQKAEIEATDEAMLLEAIDQKVAYVQAHPDNFKITTQQDFVRLKTILGDFPEDFRIGIGQDSHFFEEERKGLVLGGIEFPEELKLSANSDGDVVLHALFNAVSQAIGEMSLGFYADEMCEKGIKDSKKYIEALLKTAKKQKFKINSVGLMIEAKTPKIDPLTPKIKKSLSALLGLDTRRIGITATSGEYCTAFGQGLGIQCFAIVSLVQK